jgi:SH3 domain protein
MKAGSWPRALAMFLGLCVWMVSANAETVYVSDRFEIGVHDNTNLDSVILAVIASGTPLTVIARNGEFVQVSTPDGTIGWVDARYIIGEQPGVAVRDEQEAKLRETQRTLGDARAEAEVLRQRITELQRDAATAAHDSPAIAKPISQTPNEDSAKLEDAQRALSNLKEENRELKTNIADLQASLGASEKRAADSDANTQPGTLDSLLRGPVSNEAKRWTPSQWLMAGSILLLSFAAGGYMVDWDSRRRHGGFRV